MIGNFKVDSEKLRKIGLTLWVQIEPVDESGASTLPPKRVGAILDTGSPVCGINPPTAAALLGAARTKQKIWTPTHSFREEDALLCKITFEDGASRTLKFSIIQELEPYEVLIGRDLLSEMKLIADFKTGEWSLSWSGEDKEPGQPSDAPGPDQTL